jgi:hypothetical protein
MKRHIVITITGLALLSTSALADTASQSTPFTFQSLMNLISSNKVSSVDSLIPLLPDSYKKNFVLMFQSGSLQSASPTSPRVIAYGDPQPLEDVFPGKNLDRLYIAFQTDTSPQSKLPHSIEAIEWAPSERAYHFYRIDFPAPGATNSELTFEKDPLLCTGCHGVPSRPNWTSYPRWDGAFGNNFNMTGKYNDTRHTVPEARELIENLKSTNDRLKSMDFSLFFPNYGIGGISDDLPAQMSGKIGNQLILRSVPFIESSPNFDRLKFSFAGAFLGCANFTDFFEPRALSSLQEGVFAHLDEVPNVGTAQASSAEELTFERLWRMTAPLIQRSAHFSTDFAGDVTITTWLRFLFEGTGHAPLLKNFLGSPPMAPDNPAWSYDFTRFGTSLSAVAARYFRDQYNLTNNYPGFENLYALSAEESKWVYEKYKLSEVVRTENGPAAKTCTQLAKASREATAFLGTTSAADSSGPETLIATATNMASATTVAPTKEVAVAPAPASPTIPSPAPTPSPSWQLASPSPSPETQAPSAAVQTPSGATKAPSSAAITSPAEPEQAQAPRGSAWSHFTHWWSKLGHKRR